jgi:hypothetical protein
MERKIFAKEILATWGKIGLVIWQRGIKIGLDRKKLFGKS